MNRRCEVNIFELNDGLLSENVSIYMQTEDESVSINESNEMLCNDKRIQCSKMFFQFRFICSLILLKNLRQYKEK